MSASQSSIPGGQPSTTQPIAGPWLSPKVVTVKSRPKLLPDIFVFAKQEYALTTHRKFQPRKADPREASLKCALAVAHLDDQDAIFGEEAGCIMQDRYHRIQTVGARRKAERRLVTEFGRQIRHFLLVDIGRIADNDVVDVLALVQARKKVRFDQPDPGAEPEALDIDGGHCKRVGGHVYGIHLDFRKRQGNRDGNAAAAGTEIECA